MSSPTPPAPPEQERLPFGTIVAVGVAAVVLFSGAVLFTRTMLRDETRAALPAGEAPAPKVGQDEIGIVDQRMFELEGRAERLRREQLQRLGSYGWVDRDAGVIHVPITRAMDEVVSDLAREGGSP
ncbi:MAG TPA: hypothetical protein VND93_15730 [Myxococcales bacterium]|nr:hypothetical protein [Myxococcales bacterium]